MQIYINGEAREISNDLSMSGLVDLLDLTGERLAAEVNEELVPRSEFAQYNLQAEDKVEIIHAVGGG